MEGQGLGDRAAEPSWASCDAVTQLGIPAAVRRTAVRRRVEQPSSVSTRLIRQQSRRSQVAMALACIPIPFKGCAFFQESLLQSIDGEAIDLCETTKHHQVVLITLDANCASPSASFILFELFHQLLLADSHNMESCPRGDCAQPQFVQMLMSIDCRFVIITPGPVHVARAIQTDLLSLICGANAADVSGSMISSLSAASSASTPRPDTIQEAAHQLISRLPIVLDVDAVICRNLQLFGLDGRATPAVFMVHGPDLAIGYRQFSNAFAADARPFLQELLCKRGCAEALGDATCALGRYCLMACNHSIETSKLASADGVEVGPMKPLRSESMEMHVQDSSQIFVPAAVWEHILEYCLDDVDDSGIALAIQATCRGLRLATLAVLANKLHAALDSLGKAMPDWTTNATANNTKDLATGIHRLFEADGNMSAEWPGNADMCRHWQVISRHADVQPVSSTKLRSMCHGVLKLARWSPSLGVGETSHSVTCHTLQDSGLVQAHAAFIETQKMAGNRHFGRGRFRAALDCYEAGLTVCRPSTSSIPAWNQASKALSIADSSVDQPPSKLPMQVVMHSNLAATNLRLGQPCNAVNAATSALEQCPSYAKARMHRIKANLAQFKASLARRDVDILRARPLDTLSQPIVAELQTAEASLLAMEADLQLSSS
eukprot:SAG31_NODE_3776_length_3895_cov_2.698103_1_plen_662_part_00